jgi:hypothetical protein
MYEAGTSTSIVRSHGLENTKQNMYCRDLYNQPHQIDLKILSCLYEQATVHALKVFNKLIDIFLSSLFFGDWYIYMV